MANDRPKTKRCVIYTRKSSEEGLDQSYNSLAAQRDACAAYIASQKHEGWVLIDKTYDDGGFSGGSLERPALQELFNDLKQGKVDIIIVYKVDRLTRSLADFAKLTELFDQYQASFVAVTQQFNTSTSMGRLTLNVLLSFAQFEREVAGERIRDKIRASKKRGMWMGGHPPLGYDARDRKLVVNETEARSVRHIFQRYLEVGSMRLLAEELAAVGITSKLRHREDGRTSGGIAMKRGALEYLLKNQIYLGKIVHKGEHFDGQHEPIVTQELFASVQYHLAIQGPGEVAKRKLASPSILQGLVYDSNGARLQPTHSKKHGRKYRYYVSSSIIKDVKGSKDGLRVPAPDLEQLVLRAVSSRLRDKAWLQEAFGLREASQLLKLAEQSNGLASEVESTFTNNTGVLFHIINRIEISKSLVKIKLAAQSIQRLFHFPTAEPLESDVQNFEIAVESHLLRCGKQLKLILGVEPNRTEKFDPKLVREIVQAREWFGSLISGKAATIAEVAKLSGVSSAYVSMKISLAFLAPDIVESILAGTQPVSLTMERLRKACPLPASWADQRALLLN